jgi:hypothetical protein
MPPDLRVSLLRGAPCAATARTVHSSKAVGEPPLFLGLACWFAVRDAIAAARADSRRMGSGGGEGGGSGGDGQGGDKGEGSGGHQAGHDAGPWFDLQLPATAEAIRLAVGPDVTTAAAGVVDGEAPALSL